MFKAITGIFFLILIGLAAAFYFGMENPPVSLSLTSPNKTYTAQLNERADRYLLPIHLGSRNFPSEVRFTAFKGEHSIAQNEMLWTDSSDNRLDVYKYRWVTDSIIKYGGGKPASESKTDEVTISNDSNQAIDYLIVHAVEQFLILDFQSQASVKITSIPQPWLPWISCEGRFSSGKVITPNGVNFLLHETGENHTPQHYFISIRDDETLIQSQEAEGHKSFNGVRTRVPKF